MKRNWSRRELEALGEPINPELPTRLERKAGGGGKGGSPPPPPDYTAAAEAQGKSSMEAIQYQTQANRPNIQTPWGSQTWSGGADNNWTQTTTLTPDAENALNSQLNMQKGRSDIANSLMPQAEAAVTNPIDYSNMIDYGSKPEQSQFNMMGNAPQLQTSVDTSGVPQLPGQFSADGIPGMPTYDSNFVQDVQNQALDFMRPDQQRQQADLDAKLAGQGIAYGSRAWETAQRRMADQQARDKYQALNTAMSQGNQMYSNQLAANQQGFNQADRTFGNNLGLNSQGFNQATNLFSLGNAATQNQNALNMANNTFNNQTMQNQFAQQQQQANYQNQLRQQQIAEAQMRQLQPLNNINALLTGQQVAMPSMPTFNTAGAAQPVNYLGAAQSQYSADLGAYNAQQAAGGALTSGLFGLGGAMLGGAGAAGGFGNLFSLGGK